MRNYSKSPQRFVGLGRRIILAGSIAAALVCSQGRAANQTWDGGSAVDGSWSTGANWLGSAAPGSTSGTSSSDIATFNAAVTNSWGNSVGNPVVIDTGRNIWGINFDTAAGNYFIGGTIGGTGPGGNALLLTDNSAIQILSTLTATNAVETINAPLVIEGGYGFYAFNNNSANGSGAGAGTLDINGGISGGTPGSLGLTLGGSNTNANTISGVIANGGATTVNITKSGIGTWVLSGANTYTGTTTVNGGTLTLNFGAVSSNILPSSSALTLGGGTLALSGTGTQTVNGLTTTAGTANAILMGANETLNLGALATVSSGTALYFNTVAGGANATTSTVGTGVIVLTGPSAGNAINSSFTVGDAGGFGLATVNASNQVVRLTTTALLPASGASSATDYRINNNAGGSTAAGSYNLVVSASESARSITVDTTANNGLVTLNSGVVLSNNTWNFGGNGSKTWRISGSTFGAGLKAAASGTSINFNNYNTGTVTIALPILDNGTTAVSVSGTGTLVFAGANTYTGNTTISGGTLRISSGGSISTSSSYVYVGSNAGDNGTLNIAGGSVSSWGGILGSNAGSSGTATVSSGSWYISGNILNVGYGGTGTLNVSGGSVSGNPSNSSLNVGASSCVGIVNITGGSVSGFNTVNIGQSSGSTAMVTISGGKLNSPTTVGGTGTGVLNITGGTVTSSTLTLAYSSGSAGTLNIGTGGTAGALQASAVSGGSGTALVNFNHTGPYTFAPQLSGHLSVNQLGTGTTILSNSNSYTGATGISVGQLIATNAGALNPTGGGPVTVAAGAGLGYAASTNAPLGLHSTLAITGGAGTSLGGSIGSTATSAKISVTGAASATGNVQVNIYSIGGVTPLAGTNTYTLLTGGAGSSLNGATYSLGTVYGNTNFTVGGITSTATALQVGITSATPIANAYWVGGLGGAANAWAASNGSTASNWATAGGTVQGLIPGAGANVVISATSPITAPVATVLGANMSIAGLTIADTVNGLGLNADGFTLTVGAGGITMNAGVPTSAIGANVVLGSSQTWTNNSANTLTVNGVFSGNSTLTKDGAGAIILSGTNTYTGAITINAGALQLGNSSAIGSPSSVTMANVAGALLNLAGFDTQVGSLAGGGALGGDIALGAATLTVRSNNSPATYGGVISGVGGAFTKIGTAPLTLTGASTYTGQTTVSGPLVLAFGSVATDILPSASSLVLKSSTLSLSGTGTQTVNSLSIYTGSNLILLGANQTLDLGYLSGQSINTALNFNTAVGGANATTSTVGTGIVTLTGQTPGNAFNLGFTDFTVTDAGGFGLATVNASNQVVRLTTTTLLPASGATSSNSYLINNNAGGASAAGSSSLAVSASESASSITVDTTAASGSVTLNSGVVLSSNTWNFGGVGSNTSQIAGSASGAGLRSVASGNTITFANYNIGPITISSPILANGSNDVNIFGTGTLIFAGANTYTGNTNISGGTLQVSTGGTINASSGGASIYVGFIAGDNATLDITGGTVSGSSGYLAYFAGSSGTATISSGSWTMNSLLTVGNSGTGVLNLNGGTISANQSELGSQASGSGTATVSGGTWNVSNELYVGRYGTGALNITSGSISDSTGYLGTYAGSSGTATVSDGTWTASNGLVVGYFGSGILNLTGGKITGSQNYIGYFGGSSGTANVSGGLWNSASSLYVGYYGAGVLNLTGSGNVTVSGGSGTLTLGFSSSASGELNLGTGGTAGTLNVASVTGGSGTAVVNFNQTGSYIFTPQLTGSLSVNKLGGGTTYLTASNTYTGPTTVSAGILVVDGAISGSTTTVQSNAELAGTGILGAVSIQSGGTLQPGDLATPGLLSSGDFSLLSGGHLSLEIGGVTGTGTSSTLYSELNVNGNISLAGDLQISLFNGYTPNIGDTFYIILNSGSNTINGTFSNDIGGIIASSGIEYQVNYQAADNGRSNDVSLTVLSVPEPSVATSLIGALGLLGTFRRRKRS